jgi:hypothetical protein
MLSALSETGMAEKIYKEYEVTREDLELLAIISREEAELQHEINEAERKKREG